jgi:hypothetical protein
MSRDAGLPRFMAFKPLARHITDTRFSVSHRTVERWPLVVKIINGKRHADTAHALALADKMIDEAPAVATGSPLHHSRRKLRLVGDGSQEMSGAAPPRAAPVTTRLDRSRNANGNH